MVVREHFDNARLTTRELDQDGDGVRRRVDYDNYGEPIARKP